MGIYVARKQQTKPDSIHQHGNMVESNHGTSGPHIHSKIPYPLGNRNTNHELYRSAYHDSDGYFYDIPVPDWKRLMQRVQSTPDCARQCEGEWAIAWYQNNFEPSFTCQHERRIGNWGDGGKWVCDPHRIGAQAPVRGCLVYSVGSFNDFSFEERVLQDVSSDCEIHTLDPTIGENSSNLPHNKKVSFHPWGLANADNGNYKTLHTIVSELGHTSREIDILKIDCEGCEWSTYESWFAGGVKIRQILVELHGGTDDGNPPAAMKFLSFLKELGYVVFHKESNTVGCAGQCIEYSFIRLARPEDRE